MNLITMIISITVIDFCHLNKFSSQSSNYDLIINIHHYDKVASNFHQSDELSLNQ